jgi:hypothetical protein
VRIMEIKRIVKNAEDFLRNWREPVFFNGLVFRGLERRVDKTKIVRVFCIRNSKSTITQKKPPRGRFSDNFYQFTYTGEQAGWKAQIPFSGFHQKLRLS